MVMSMPLVWKYDCRFLFAEWESKTIGEFILGCLICSVLGLIIIVLPTIRKLLLLKLSSDKSQIMLTNSEQNLQQIPKNKFNVTQHISSIFLYLVHAFLHIIVMLLVMTVNGYVILSIMLGLTLGYSFVSPYCDRSYRKVQCCHKDQKHQSVLTNQFQNQS